MKKLAAIVLAFLTAACGGVADINSSPRNSAYNGVPLAEARSSVQAGLGSISYRAVEYLINSGSNRLDKKGTILVTSWVNVDHLEKSSTFGRLRGDQTANRLVQLGYVVKELRLGNSLVIRKETGELILSRDTRKISQIHSAQAIIAGTYAVGGRYVYINMRLISPQNERIISAVDFVTPLNNDVKRLLAIDSR